MQVDKMFNWITDNLTVFEMFEDDEVKPQNKIIITRKYAEEGTSGILQFPDGKGLFTLENPWLDNQRSISCIPEGIYEMKKRESAMVKRTSGDKYTEGWEITNVEGRTFIMVHPGNYVKNTDGCLLVGSSPDFVDGAPVIWSSRKAFEFFMTECEKLVANGEKLFIEITSRDGVSE